MARQTSPILAIFLALPLLVCTTNGMASAEATNPMYMAKKGKSGSPHASHGQNRHAKPTVTKKKGGKSHSPHVARGRHHNGPPAHAPAHGYRRKHRYHYYPEKNVYYDPDRKLYFYLDGNGWKTNAKLPSSIRLNLGKSTSLELDTDLPYKASSKD